MFEIFCEHELSNYYGLVGNNCSIVATNAWNYAFDSKEFGIYILPSNLKKDIEKKYGHFEFDVFKALGVR